ncbi:hypothetical protein WKW80_05790 [Variovorax humicola]|uniref:Uncharacterized protein n=1 Tax=Variovorax humicola TaxID=1769758 RepID=A0ABU8VVC5_9BURK
MKRRISWRRLALVLSLLSMLVGPIWVRSNQMDEAQSIYTDMSAACYREWAGHKENRPNCSEVASGWRREFMKDGDIRYRNDLLFMAVVPVVLFWLCFLILWGLYRAVSVRKS